MYGKVYVLGGNVVASKIEDIDGGACGNDKKGDREAEEYRRKMHVPWPLVRSGERRLFPCSWHGPFRWCGGEHLVKTALRDIFAVEATARALERANVFRFDGKGFFHSF